MTKRERRRPTVGPSALRIFELVAEPADRRDDVGAQLFADARDEHLDRVRIAVEILIVDMLDQIGTRYDLALVMEKIGQQFILLRRPLYRLAGEGDAARARVEAAVAREPLARRIARRPAGQ